MKKELEKKLRTRFKFFTVSPEVEDGWFDLLWNLCFELESWCFEGETTQVKEKFGGLRFYVTSAADREYRIIHAYEEKSYTICEFCGGKGKPREKLAWRLTLCFKCYIIKRIKIFFDFITFSAWRAKRRINRFIKRYKINKEIKKAEKLGAYDAVEHQTSENNFMP